MNVKKIIFYCLSLFFFGAVKSYAQTAETTMYKARRFYEQNHYSLALEKYLQALKQAEKEKNPLVMARASLSLARCHYFLYDHEASLKWSYNALHAIQQHHLDSLLSKAFYFLGVLYIEAEKVDSAENYSFKAIELFLKEKDYVSLSQTYSTLAELHLNTSKDVSKIESMIANAEKYAEMSENKVMMAFASSKRYNYCFFLKKDYEEALDHISKAEKLYLEAGSREAILNAYRGKAECLIMLRDTSAKTYMLKWFAFKDSVLQAEKSANVAKYETIYETEKKERENQLLQQENRLNRLLLFVIAVLVLLLIALALWLYNRNNLKKKQQELSMLQSLQQDKERIARDLHDNVGGQLSYIIYSLDGIIDEDRVKRIEVADSISLSVRSVINSLRETIWAISDASINVQDFSDKLKLFARTLFKHNNTQIDYYERIRTNREVKPLLALNLYRICQEILTNAFKYANASEVQIDLHCEEEKLFISIKDNGIGFDITQQNKERYGLQNIKNRAAEFGILLILETEVHKGTKYELTV